MARRAGSWIYVGSVLLHAGGALAVARLETPEVREPTSITIQEVRKPKAPPKAEAPPPPPPPEAPPKAPVHKAARKAEPAPEPIAEVAPAAAPAPMFGLTLSGGVGVSGGGGIAVPTGPMSARAAEKKPLATRTAPPKALVVKPAASTEESCLEALVKPKPIAIPQPEYARRAREAGISGKVRVELTLDETGQVVESRVLEGLGYGLDEAALEAARSARFEPATRCGKATRTTFVIGIRFAL